MYVTIGVLRELIQDLPADGEIKIGISCGDGHDVALAFVEGAAKCACEERCGNLNMGGELIAMVDVHGNITVTREQILQSWGEDVA